MCGIVGYVRSEPGPAIDLAAMVASLAHRGPDDGGSFEDAGMVGIGMRRLAVIDCSGGRQPMADHSGDLQVVFNGEIYNHRRLRAELASLGHCFTTRSDTEVLVHGYEEWGDGLAGRLRGMFAFAIWDRKRRRLLLARDPLGVKPLYYAEAGEGLVFGSEIKALLASGLLAPDVDLAALDSFLAFGYVPEPRTIFPHVFVLPPAHLMRWQSGRMLIERYWSPPEPGAAQFADRRSAVLAVRDGFEDSVSSMLEADVPLGLFLSGGLDSAGILAMMARHSAAPVQTFSIGFGHAERRWDELDAARSLARRFGTNHREIRVDTDIIATLPDVVAHFDQPFANPTAVILYLLAQQARAEVTVALSGTGGDELFAGYPRYLAMRWLGWYQHLPVVLRRSAETGTKRLVRDSTNGRTSTGRLRRFATAAALPAAEAYAALVTSLDQDRRAQLYTPELRDALSGVDATESLRSLLGGGDPMGRLLAADQVTYLPGNQLTYGDRMTMAHGLELRVPFADHRLAEVASGIPLAWHTEGGRTKSVFREAMAPFLPQEVIRGRKLGLNLPISLWFRDSLASWVRSLLDSLGRRAYFRPSALIDLLDEHVSGQRDNSLPLWALVVFETWHQQYLDAPRSPGSPPDCLGRTPGPHRLSSSP